MQADMLPKKADAAAKRHSVILCTGRLIEEQKKMYESPKWKCSVSPLFAGMSYFILLLAGYEMVYDQGKRMYERQEPEESN
ncbi:unnamed protein product [Urochloa humidicola]